MIHTFTAFTDEIDDPEVAVEEISEQLAAKGPLLKNTVGLLNCYPDFTETGTVKAICDALPFTVIGCTTLASASNKSDSLDILTIMVLTSDDVHFETGLTESITGEKFEFFDSAYKNSIKSAEEAGYSEKPSLIISYAPLLLNVGGDFIIQSMSKTSGGVPNFGTLPIDYTTDYSKSRVIYNGEAYADKYAFLLLIGDVNPKFYVAGVDLENVLNETGVVTDVEGNQIKTINGMSASDFMVTLGLKKDENDKAIGVNSYPFIIDYNDGTEPVLRVIFMITEDGYAVCGGDVPQNATLSVGMFDVDNVLKSTEQKLVSIMNEKPSSLLMFSCVGRYFAQGYEPERETSIVRKLAEGADTAYTFTYSGGEISPVYHMGTTNTENRFHNDTFVACSF